MTAPIVATARHRLQTDGRGVTTLVAFHGCPLRCRYCLNPFSFDPRATRRELTAQELYERVKIDELYFLATGGGITFGGGEPLLYADFLQEFRAVCGPEWHLCAETSLAIPWEQVEKALGCIDVFYVDCKDLNPTVYHDYTGGDSRLMISNLERLLRRVSPERVVVRLPLIPSYNTEEHRRNSRKILESMGVVAFDEFTYITKRT